MSEMRRRNRKRPKLAMKFQCRKLLFLYVSAYVYFPVCLRESESELNHKWNALHNTPYRMIRTTNVPKTTIHTNYRSLDACVMFCAFTHSSSSSRSLSLSKKKIFSRSLYFDVFDSFFFFIFIDCICCAVSSFFFILLSQSSPSYLF